ncbi:hypothetical protein [Streptomyces sp. TRM68367]|uniref:hypothetical protein n=1 Tax=Streptomyces sp. TRM68367 TaxID=2758415 RepID=UPI0021CF1866|nr:hypothetical protein [Streptomyces sp. TRM68367]
MDLTAVLLRAAAIRPRVLLVTMPAGVRVRLAAERELRVRDLPLALTPAEADILLIAGPRCPDLDEAVDRLWQDMPAPRARVRAEQVEDVAGVIDAACAQLADAAGQRAGTESAATSSHDGHTGNSPDAADDSHGDRQHGDNSDGDHYRGDQRHQAGAGGEGHANHQQGGDDDGSGEGDGEGQGHSGHEGHGGHGGGEMEMPAGLPMAEQGPDRDGLTLDQLHVPLGPLLADWPSGLTLRLTLQGDVVQETQVEMAVPHDAAAVASFWSEPWDRAVAGERVGVGEAARRRAAARLDSLGRFLAVAGWPAEATAARRLRDDLLAGAAADVVLPRARRLARRVGRSRTLYWLTRGIGPLTASDAADAGVGGPAARADGDVPARYRLWLATMLDDLARLEDASVLDPSREEGPRGRLGGARPPSAALVEVLPRLLEGAELAAARLIVASLDPDPEELAARSAEVARG